MLFRSVSAAQPAPSVFSASVTSPGNNGDPDLRFYTPDAVSFPVWKWDSSQFWAASKDDTEYNPPSPGAILNFPIGGTSRIAAAGAYNPWYTIAA